MRSLTVFIFAVGAMASVGSAITREELLAQARAADVIGDVVTTEAERAQICVDTLERLVRATGGQEAFGRFAPTTNSEREIDYRDLFAGVVLETQKLESSSPDGSMINLTDHQLFQEMTALQGHNQRQFVRLNQLRRQSGAMRQYLQSIKKLSGPAATQPAVASPSELLVMARERADEPRSDEWARRRKQVRNAISARFEAMRLRAQDRATSGGQQFTLTPTGSLDDPRFSPYFYGIDDGWSGWSNDFSDAFDFRGGGGLYRRNDTRVNRDTDIRMQGQFDRRLNIESDRRLNIHVDPRENY